MKFTEDYCRGMLTKDFRDIKSYFLIDTYEGTMSYSISYINDGVLFDCLISNDELYIACVNFLISNGNQVYKNLNEFKNKNPDVIC